jgi:hypothetical protein
MNHAAEPVASPFSQGGEQLQEAGGGFGLMKAKCPLIKRNFRFLNFTDAGLQATNRKG